MSTPARPELRRPGSVAEAAASLAELGDDGAVIAGASWVMRAWMRGEPQKRVYVALKDIPGLARVERGDPTVIGALATHAQLETLDGPLAALAEAAERSGFPALRNVATIGGNICARPFPEADLVPALLALDASVDIASLGGTQTLSLAEYLAGRDDRPAGELLESVSIPAPAGRASAYERVSVRASGEYPISAIAVSLERDADGVARAVRVAVGVVEAVARRSPAAERVLEGKPLDGALAEEAGRAAAGELGSRDGVDAPGWYRLAVLPALLRTALDRVARGG